jgi:hypothetical protein
VKQQVKQEEPKVPVVGFSFSFNLDGTRENYNSVVAQYHVPIDTTLSDMHAVADKIVDVVDRQRLRYKLKDLDRELHVTQVFVDNATTDLTRIHLQAEEAFTASGRKGTYRPSKHDSGQILAAKNNVDNSRLRLDRIKAEIIATKDKLGVTG